MQSRLKTYTLFVGTLLFVLVVIVASCSKKLSHEGMVVFTQIPVNAVSVEELNTLESKYASSMRITMSSFVGSGDKMEILTADFNSARSPEISFDGKTMVFSAQKSEGDPWQIWTMNLETKDVIQVSDSRTNCTDPTWLPNGDIAFSKLVTDEKALKYHALFTVGIDGCCEQRITFQPHEDVNATVMHDGRILVASKQVYPENGPFKYLALRPDGTKAEVFYLADQTSNLIGKAVETGDGRVIFPESNTLTSINFNRPLHTKNTIHGQEQGFISSIYKMDVSNLLVSIKKPNELTYRISIINVDNMVTEDFYYNDSEYHAVEAVIVKARAIPRKLPTRVNPDMDSGYLIAMNTDASDIKADGKTAKVQVLGMNSIIGETAVMADGSFYIELAADRPVRFQSLDENGDILRGPSSWMWVRPNERRGCVGCHQDREITPENVVPIAIEKAPIAMIR